jgi:signal transduction histidine kinase
MSRFLFLLLASSLLLIVAILRRRQFNPAPADAAFDTVIPGQIPVARVICDALRRLEVRAHRQFVRLEAAVDDTLMIAGDREALAELLSVLCLHAIESTPCGRVLVTAIHRDTGTTIAIVDDGIGMDTARTERRLEVSREALSLLGGTLDVKRRQGVGSTVTIRLPVPETVPTTPWNATIQSTMADYTRVTATQSSRAGAEQRANSS